MLTRSGKLPTTQGASIVFGWYSESPANASERLDCVREMDVHGLPGSCRFNPNWKTGPELVIARGDAAIFLEAANAPFDGRAPGINDRIEWYRAAPLVSPLIAALWNGGSDAVLAQPAPDAPVAVALLQPSAVIRPCVSSWAALSVAQADLFHER